MRTVALVLDPDFGQRIEDIAREMPVWVLSSPLNDPAIEKARRVAKGVGGITSFVPRPSADRAAACAQVLYDIDEHHGMWSASDPYEELLVFGAGPGDFSAKAIGDLALESAGAQQDAFVFRKRNGAKAAAR